MKQSTQVSVASSHNCPVHGSLPASQPTDGLHTSAPLQNRPLLHAALFGVLSHESVASLQESTVQATESL